MHVATQQGCQGPRHNRGKREGRSGERQAGRAGKAAPEEEGSESRKGEGSGSREVGRQLGMDEFYYIMCKTHAMRSQLQQSPTTKENSLLHTFLHQQTWRSK